MKRLHGFLNRPTQGEAKPLAELAAKKRRGVQPIGDLLVNLLLRLGVGTEDQLESKPSEALES